VTELVQNAIEHAFVGRASGSIAIELAHTNGEVIVEVRDDGVGIRHAVTESGRLGLQIVRTLIEELGGHFAVISDGGTTASVHVPAKRVT
jgi:two-component sensor histidine kinase